MSLFFLLLLFGVCELGETEHIQGILFDPQKRRKLYSEWVTVKLRQGMKFEKTKRHFFDIEVYKLGFEAMKKKLGK